MAAAAQQAAMQAALGAHDRVRRSTDLPLFFGRADKDTISARLLVDRIETAAQIAGWNDDARKLQEMYMILRDRAVVWWRSLPDAGIDRAVWDDVKNEFLAMYEPRYTAKTTCTNFQDLVQRVGESIRDYYLRVCETFDRMCEAKPAAIGTLRTVPAAVAAAVPAIVPADLTAMKTEGIKDMEQFFRHQLFMAGLRDDLRAKVMEAGKATLHESMRYAQEMEIIQHDKRGRAVAAVAAANTSDQPVADEEEEDFTEEELKAVNAIRFRQGKPPFRPNFRRFNGNGNNGKSKTVVCRFCKKQGHIQKECRARLRANAPMVDANGKPYEKKVFAAAASNGSQVNSVTTDDAATTKSHTVGSIVAGAMNALNW